MSRIFAFRMVGVIVVAVTMGTMFLVELPGAVRTFKIVAFTGNGGQEDSHDEGG